jgi:hypothetical protein
VSYTDTDADADANAPEYAIELATEVINGVK